MNELINSIRTELTQQADSKLKDGYERYFREPVVFYGVKTAKVGEIAKKYWKEVKHLPKKKIFEMCGELYESDYCEEAFVAANWLPRISAQFEYKDLKLFKRWIDSYINNWAKCDGFCNHTVGDFINKYPDAVTELKKWTKSTNRWTKRASAVSLILPARRGEFLDDIFEIACALLTDKDDMVQKGYGWMLKEASKKHQREVFEFVINYKSIMPRTALRYAIELMPQDMRKQAMSRE